ncbi:MAG: alpha/beta hydrolase [Saprospiraceae bacterium]|nr:alpha/beta hydrolase [Saprospiraceae bacterium]
MKISTVLTFVFLPVVLLNAQTSLEQIDLSSGKYKVGFKHYTNIDSTRTYRIKNEFNNQFIDRPIPISIWYPAEIEDDHSQQLTVLDYLEILKEEEEWGNLPNEFLLDWFHYLWNTAENRAHLTEKVNAFSNSNFINGKFPVVVYAPSYQASSIENFALFEYLASNGFVVISSPSRGTETRELEGGTSKDMETQSRDVEFLLKELHKYDGIDRDKIALMGFSFGGLSNAITVMKNKNIKALISLDGTERYRYNILEKSAYFNLDNLNVPYVHFAQKDIPEVVLREDKIPERLNYEFQLYDSLKYSNVYRYKFHDLTHSNFSSYGILFGNRDKRQDKSDDKIMASYRQLSEYVLQHLNATLNKEDSAMKFIEKNPEQDWVSKKMKKSRSTAFDYKNFNDLAVHQAYEDLIPLYKSTLAQHPQLQLEERMLNTLGLRLSFDPNKREQGINVLLLAVHLYPKSANLYDSLAEAYLSNQDFENAMVHFKKSLALNPENQNAINRLKQLKQ